MIKDLFELSTNDAPMYKLGTLEVPEYSLKSSLVRAKISLPYVDEYQLVKHFNDLTKSVNDIDSCSLKVDQKSYEEIISLGGFSNIHPLQRSDRIQGSLAVISTLSMYLLEILGMADITLQPASSAEAEYTALMLIKQYYTLRNDKKRKKIIVANTISKDALDAIKVLGFEIVEIEDDANESINPKKLKKLLRTDVAALMIQSPNALGYFAKDIREIQRLVHGVGALMYLDGASLRSSLGIVRPGDMGFDIVHFDFEKTFGLAIKEGMGCSPVACMAMLQDYLPNPRVVWNERLGDYRYKYAQKSMGKVAPFFGNMAAMEKVLAYIITLGSEGIKDASDKAIINANYLRASLNSNYKIISDRTCVNAFTITRGSKVDLDLIAKTLVDAKVCYPTKNEYGITVEITGAQTKESLDKIAKALNALQTVSI